MKKLENIDLSEYGTNAANTIQCFLDAGFTGNYNESTCKGEAWLKSSPRLSVIFTTGSENMYFEIQGATKECPGQTVSFLKILIESLNSIQ